MATRYGAYLRYISPDSNMMPNGSFVTQCNFAIDELWRVG